jgi:hypothetical protein
MLSLDHLGLVGSSIGPLRQTWLDRGFCVTEPEALMALDPCTGQRVSLGQQSCHIIFERGYLELTAVDTVTPEHHLYPWIGGPQTHGDATLAIIAIGADDIDGVHARLAEAGLPVGTLAQASRPIHYGTRRGDALFRWFMLSAASTPESLVCFVRNERPELIFQPEVQQHPNGARALESVILCSNEPEVMAAWYARYADSAVVKAALGLFRCALHGGVVWVGTAASLEAHFGIAIEHSPGDAPRAVGFGIAPDRIFWVSRGSLDEAR